MNDDHVLVTWDPARGLPSVQVAGPAASGVCQLAGENVVQSAHELGQTLMFTVRPLLAMPA